MASKITQSSPVRSMNPTTRAQSRQSDAQIALAKLTADLSASITALLAGGVSMADATPVITQAQKVLAIATAEAAPKMSPSHLGEREYEFRCAIRSSDGKSWIAQAVQVELFSEDDGILWTREIVASWTEQNIHAYCAMRLPGHQQHVYITRNDGQ